MLIYNNNNNNDDDDDDSSGRDNDDDDDDDNDSGLYCQKILKVHIFCYIIHLIRKTSLKTTLVQLQMHDKTL